MERRNALRGERVRRRAGESVGKGIMINTCIWFQWLPGRLEKAPAGLQWGGSNEQQERERPTTEEEQNHHRGRAKPPQRKSAGVCLRFDTSVLFCVIKHPFSGSPPLDFLVLPSLTLEPRYNIVFWIYILQFWVFNPWSEIKFQTPRIFRNRPSTFSDLSWSFPIIQMWFTFKS